MNTQRSILALAIAVGLSACGGGGSGSGADTNSGSGNSSAYTARAADGYLEGAVACLDLNENKACDDDEPSAVTNENGEFTITGLTNAEHQTSAVVIEIVPGQTIDQDNPGVPLTKAYTLTAPPGSQFISPLTTLVQNELEKGRSMESAIATVKSQLGALGADVELNRDYIQAKASEAASDAEREAYSELHRVAQITATVMANATDSLDAAQGGIEDDELKALIIEQALQMVDDALSAMGHAGDKIDIDHIASHLPLYLSQDNLKDKWDELDAIKQAEEIDFKRLLASEPLTWFEGVEEEAKPQAFHYGAIQLNDESQFEEQKYAFDHSIQGFAVQADDNEMRQMILSHNGWVVSDPSVVGVDAQADGSAIFVKAVPELNEHIWAEKVDISGLNVRALIKDAGGEHVWAHYLAQSLAFPADSRAYKIESNLVAEGYYRFNQGDWCEKDFPVRYETLGNMCNGLSSSTASGETWLTALDSTIAQDASDRSGTRNTTGLLPIAGVESGEVYAQLMLNGDVIYYLVPSNGDHLVKYKESGSWQDIAHNNHTLRQLTLPDDIAEQTTWSEFNTQDGALYLTNYQGYLRVVWHIDEDDSQNATFLFDQQSAQFIVDHFRPMNLATCLASLPDADFEKQIGDIWEQNVQRSVSSINDGAISNWRYELEHMSDNASWLNRDTIKVAGLPDQLFSGVLSATVIRGYDESGTIALVEKHFEDKDHYFGGVGRGQGTQNWGIVKVLLPTPVSKSQLLLGQTYQHEDAAMADLTDVVNASEGTSFDELQKQHFTYTQQFLGKRKVDIASEEYQVCHVLNVTHWGRGTANDTDSDLVWLNNRGVVKQVRDEPSLGAKTMIEVTSMPSLD